MKTKKSTDAHACTCEKCVALCKKRSCWPTPKEAQALIDAGLGNKLMQDYYTRRTKADIQLLCPALVGYERKTAPFMPFGTCTFLVDDKCELHDKNLKPFEAQLASGCSNKTAALVDANHAKIVAAWDTKLGRALVKRWQKQYLIVSAMGTFYADATSILEFGGWCENMFRS